MDKPLAAVLGNIISFTSVVVLSTRPARPPHSSIKVAKNDSLTRRREKEEEEDDYDDGEGDNVDDDDGDDDEAFEVEVGEDESMP